MRARPRGGSDRWAIAAVVTAGIVVATAMAQFVAVRLVRNEVVHAGSVAELLAAMDRFREVRLWLGLAAGVTTVFAFGAFGRWLREVWDIVGAADSRWAGRWYEWLVPGVNMVVPPLVVAGLLARICVQDAGWQRRGRLLVTLWWSAGLAFAGYTAYRWASAPDVMSSGTQALVDGARQPGPELVASAEAVVDASRLVVSDGIALTALVVAAGLHVRLITTISRTLRRPPSLDQPSSS